MSKLIRFASANDFARPDFLKALVWFSISCMLTMLLGFSLFAQDPVAAAKPAANPLPLETIKFDPAYDKTKPELQLTGNESKQEARTIRANAKIVRDKIRSIEKKIKLALEGNAGMSTVSGVFDTFMVGYVFAGMTQTDDVTLASLGELREDFVDDYLSEKVKGGARQRVIQIAIPTLQKIADGNFHKAVKLNAIIALGMIDETPTSRKSNTLPTPAAEAMRYLSKNFTSDTPAYLKIGALAGILRHVEVDHLRVAPQLAGTDGIGREALAIVQGGGVGSANWTPEAKYWLKRRAVQLLGFLGQPGPNGVVVDELLKIAQDQEASKWLRFDAIAGLGRLNFVGVDSSKAVQVPTVVANYVADSFEYESNDLKKKLDDLIEVNILYEDVDLVKVGNAGLKKKGGSRGGGIGSGAGLPDGPEGGGGAGSGKPKDEIDLGPQVEIATYHLNNARRIAKVIAYTAKATLTSKSLSELVDKVQLARMIAELNAFIANSDLGITNLEKDEELEIDEDDPNYEAKLREAKKPVTIKMYEFLAESAKDMRRLVPAAADPKDDADPLGSN